MSEKINQRKIELRAQIANRVRNTKKASVAYEGQDEKIGHEFKWTLRKGGEKNIIFWQGCLHSISNESSQ